MRLPSRAGLPRWARAATSAWILSPLLVLALLVGVFFAYGAYTRSKPTHYARGGDSFALTPSESPSAVATRSARHKARTDDKKSPTNHAASSDRDTAPHVVSATQAPSGSGQSSSGGRTGRGGTSSGSAIVTPRAGSYALSVSGSEHVKFGPFSACTNTFPSSSSLVVQPASGEPAGSFNFDLRFYPNNPNRHDERHIYRYGDAGVFLSYEQATVTCGGVKQSSAVNYDPAQPRVRQPLSSGASWRSTCGDSARTERATTQVVGSDTVVIDGHTYSTWVIDTHVDMSGDESGTRDQRWWWSPDLGMPVKWHESLSGKRSGATYSEDVTITVVGLP